MDIQAMIGAMSQSWYDARTRYHVTLGAAIERLAACDQDAIVVLSDAPGSSPGAPDSYRGYYSDLAFPEVSHRPVSAVLADCRSVLDQTLTGYKGGDFTMDSTTPLWVAEYGDSSNRAVVDIREADGKVEFVVKTLSD